MMEYIVKPKYAHEQVIFFNDSGEIKEGKIVESMAKLFSDGRIVCFYMVDNGKTYYKKPVTILLEEHKMFETPEKVAEDIVKKYEEAKSKKENDNSGEKGNH